MCWNEPVLIVGLIIWERGESDFLVTLLVDHIVTNNRFELAPGVAIMSGQNGPNTPPHAHTHHKSTHEMQKEHTHPHIDLPRHEQPCAAMRTHAHPCAGTHANQ